MSEREVAMKATEVLRSMFGSKHVPDPIGCRKSSWKSEAFTRGSWAYVPFPKLNNASPSASNTASDLGGIDEYVLYAGEAENYEHRGTVHGAYLSGEEKARLIIDKVNALP